MRLTCSVVDDEPLAVELMEGYVRKTPFLELKGAFYSASAAFESLQQEAVDLLFCGCRSSAGWSWPGCCLSGRG